MPGIYHKLLYFYFHNMILRIIYTDVLPFYFTCYHNRAFIYNATREREENKGSELCSLELLTRNVTDWCKSWDKQERIQSKREYVKLMRGFNSHGNEVSCPFFFSSSWLRALQGWQWHQTFTVMFGQLIQHRSDPWVNNPYLNTVRCWYFPTCKNPIIK